MDNDLVSAFFAQIVGVDIVDDETDSETEAWFESLPLPLGLKRALQWNWPNTGIDVGPIHFYSPVAIRTEEWNSLFIPTRLIQIGVCPNGDAFAVDFDAEHCPTGYVTHEELNKSNPRESFLPTFRSLESFLYRVAENRFVPRDYYEAKSYVNFLRAEESHDAFPPFANKHGA